MALIKCPDCGKSVSSNAKSCLHCGCPIKSTSSLDMTVNILSPTLCYTIMALAFVIYFIFTDDVEGLGLICCLIFTASSIIPIFTAKTKDLIIIQIAIAIICIICFIGFASVGFWI